MAKEGGKELRTCYLPFRSGIPEPERARLRSATIIKATKLLKVGGYRKEKNLYYALTKMTKKKKKTKIRERGRHRSR